MTRIIRTDRTETAEGNRIREFARIERQTAPETTDPRVMAMTRTRDAAAGDDLRRVAERATAPRD